MRHAALVLITLLSAVSPATAVEQGVAPVEHLAHEGLGTKLGARAVARLPKKALPRPTTRQNTQGRISNLRSAERVGYRSVTSLTGGAFPTFYPGLGQVYVRPKTLPVGPFLSFDRQGRQVGTIYMLSLEDMNGHKKFDATGTRVPRTDHVSVYFHGGHPGVDFPHYHYVLWHVSKRDEARVAK